MYFSIWYWPVQKFTAGEGGGEKFGIFLLKYRNIAVFFYR